MSFSVPETVKCLEWEEISGHLKWNDVLQEAYQYSFNKWHNQCKNSIQLNADYCEDKRD
jgi:hypothetical protein